MSAALNTMALGELLPELAFAQANVIPRHLTLNSRDIQQGDVFIALPGYATDGRNFIPQALERGAVAVLAEAEGLAANDERVVPVPALRDRLPLLAKQFYGDPSATMSLIAVTGTNGKTSVVEFIAQLLRGMGVAAGTIGTLGCRLTEQPAEAVNTTPDIVSLNRQLAEWRDNGIDHVAMEASSHALDQGRLSGLTLHTGVFTNLSRDHLDYHGDEQRYAQAKRRLFTEFSLQRAIFNADDPVARSVRAIASCAAIGVSLEDSKADVFVRVQGHQPLQLTLVTPFGTDAVSANLSGSFNALNLTMAAMAVIGLGYSFAQAMEAIALLHPVPGRMQRIVNDKQLNVVVDYAHTPDALSRALSALRPETLGKLWVVFGCGGDRDSGKRPLMAQQAETLADRLVITSDNPRGEAPGAIIDDVLSGMAGDCEVVVDREQAIVRALSTAKPGDTVLIAGKGHEDYQEIDGKRIAFSDVAIAEQYFGQCYLGSTIWEAPND